MVKECREDPHFANDVELCVSEACTNAIKHGQSVEAEDVISLYFQTFPDKLIIKVQDKGSGFRLESRRGPDIASLSDRGYGLYIIQSKMDNVEYVQTAEGNFLTMTKFFKKGHKG